jgi:prepilin-type processing-associated H-X9-DG protein
VYCHSRITPERIEDGLSKTYLVSEYHWSLDQNNPTNGENYYGIGTPLAAGYVVSAVHKPQKDGVHAGQVDVADLGRMGSAHASTFNVAYCDGSVRSLQYGIDMNVHRRNANRRDGT